MVAWLKSLFSRKRKGIEYITLKANEETTARIERLRQYHETRSPAEIYQRALAILDLLTELEIEGYTPGVFKKGNLPPEHEFKEFKEIDIHRAVSSKNP